MCASLEQQHIPSDSDPSGLAFYKSGLACLPSWLGMMNAGWVCSMRL